MLIQICNNCGSETPNLQPISLKEGGATTRKEVCQRCYYILMNEQFQKESKLLNG